MTINLVTLFDSQFSSRALAMATSLDQVGLDYHLWVLCLDEVAAKIFLKFHPNRTSVLRPEDWESDQLGSIREQRTQQEYCWTLTPFAISAVFEREENVNVAFYVDADVFFFRNPSDLLHNFANSDSAAFVTRHAFSPQLEHLSKYGEFNVQLVGFNRNTGGDVLSEWRSQCAEWCFAYYEDEKFGDQKYLDVWPEKYGKRILIGQPGSAFQGPWNAARFTPDMAISYHFSSLSFLSRKYVRVGDAGYPIPNDTVSTLYIPYIKLLTRWHRQVRRWFRSEVGPLTVSDSARVRYLRRIRNLVAGNGFRGHIEGEKNVWAAPRPIPARKIRRPSRR